MKTISLKKVSAVAVAALAFGGLTSVAPANAVAQTGVATAVSAKLATANTYVSSTANRIFVGATLAAAADFAATETLIFRSIATTYPAGGFVGVTGQSNATLVFTTSAATDTGAGNSVTLLGVGVNAGTLVTPTGTDGLAAFTVTPTVAGTYSFLVWNDADDDGTFDSGEPFVNVPMTITAAADLSPSGSVAWSTCLTAGCAAAASSSTNALPVAAAKTAGTYTAQISIDLKLTDGLDDDRAHTITATVSGS